MIPPTRKPDDIDRFLFAQMAKMRHEARMQEIRELDIGSWAAEVAEQ